MDNDKDGLLDAKDQCPNKAEDKDGFEDTDGCTDPDNDQDKVLDTQDACPNEREDADDWEDDDGCPDLDNDNDGFPDEGDRCPNDPETVNSYQDADGCPDAVPVEVALYTGVIPGITFDNNKDTIRSTSEGILSASLATLLQFPDMKIEIQGHTDAKADDLYNLELSQRRANQVMLWFIRHGVDPSRLRAVGYGETIAIADNQTEAGRATNRRVEFKLIQ
jgi:outer membrane protein OmpA-like peptidoglycan-associated protein